MLGTNDIVLLLAVSAIGAVVGAALKWGESGTKFDPKTFLVSFGKGMIAALVFVLGYQTVDTLQWFDYIAVFVGCAGFDALLNRGQKTVKAIRTKSK